MHDTQTKNRMVEKNGLASKQYYNPTAAFMLSVQNDSKRERGDNSGCPKGKRQRVEDTSSHHTSTGHNVLDKQQQNQTQMEVCHEPMAPM